MAPHKDCSRAVNRQQIKEETIVLRNYSKILQIDTATFLNYKHAPDGLSQALRFFFVVTLIAGFGVLFGIPVQLDRVVWNEAFEEAQALNSEIAASIEPFLQSSIPFISIPDEMSASIGNAFVGVSETLNDIVKQFEEEAELLAPPMGTRTSRVFQQFGRWISMPFVIMSNYIVLALVSMMAARLLGGRATLSQHLTVVLLAAAPLVLLLPSLIPDLSPITTIATAAAIALVGRLLALVGLIWAGIILIKGVALAHEFSWERAAGSLVFTWLLMYVLLPLLSIFVLTYLVRFG
jgi:lysylphosphatidylglycerol synthetase-like protein (DUF2156 family)